MAARIEFGGSATTVNTADQAQDESSSRLRQENARTADRKSGTSEPVNTKNMADAASVHHGRLMDAELEVWRTTCTHQTSARPGEEIGPAAEPAAPAAIESPPAGLPSGEMKEKTQRSKRHEIDAVHHVPAAHESEDDLVLPDHLDDDLLEKLAEDIMTGDVWRDLPPFDFDPPEIVGAKEVDIVASRIRKFSI